MLVSIVIQHQQQLYFFLGLLLRGSMRLLSSETLMPVDISEISPLSSLLRMLSARVLKAFSTFLYSMADIYRNLSFSLLANALPYSQVTCLQDSRSVLLPMSSTSMASLPLAFTSSIHSCRCSKVSRLVISQMSSAPMALRQQDRVMDLKFSCPAVSHICSLILRLLILRFLAANSTPMVTSWVWFIFCQISCNTTQDLPTPELSHRYLNPQQR